jgi:hypothetical protein
MCFGMDIEGLPLGTVLGARNKGRNFECLISNQSIHKN